MSRPRPPQASRPNHVRSAALASAGGLAVVLGVLVASGWFEDEGGVAPERGGAPASALAPGAGASALAATGGGTLLEAPGGEAGLTSGATGSADDRDEHVERRAATPEPAADHEREAGAEREVPARWFVEGSLSAAARIESPWELATVMVMRRASAESVSGTCDATGRFRLDVTRMAARADAEGAPLGIRVDHPLLLPETQQLQAGAFSHLSTAGERLAFTSFHLRPPTALVTGEVQARGSVQVALFALGQRGRLELVDQRRVMPGAFQLRAPGKGHYWFTAFAEGTAPATVPIESIQGGVLELPSLVLDSGLALAGKALLPGRAPASGAFVIARPADREFEPVGLLDLGFDGDRFARLSNRVQAGENGAFAFLDLSPIAYHVTVEVSPDLAPAPGSPPPARIEPPAAIEILAPVAAVTFSVTADEGPLRGARIQATWDGKRRSKNTDEAGEAELLLPSDTQGWALVTASGYAPRMARFEMPAPGVRTTKPVRLEPLGEAGSTLVLVPEGPAPDSLTVELGLPGISIRDTREVERDEEGHYVVSGLHAGRLDVRVRDRSPGSYLLPWEDEVDLPGDASSSRRFSLERGGRLRLETSGEARSLVRMELLWLGHKSLEFALLPHTPGAAPGDPGALRSSRSRYLEPGRAFDLCPTLPAGRYVLELRSRGWRRAIECEVEQGKTALRMVELPSARPRRR